jgi:hypothetical protein
VSTPAVVICPLLLFLRKSWKNKLRRVGIVMDNTGKSNEVVPGLSTDDVRVIADKIFNQKDRNHPHSRKQTNGFLDILENGKPNISASSIFIRKVSE